MTDLVLYSHPFSSYCQKAVTALHEKGLAFDERLLEAAGAMDELRARWPFGQFPVLVEGGQTHAEASIIIERLDQISPDTRMIPTDPASALQVRFMDRVFDNHVQTHQQQIIYQHLRPEPDRDAIAVSEARRKLETAYAWLDDVMKIRTWAAGDGFSLADCGAAPALLYAHWTHPIPERFTALWAYRRRLLARPSYAKALDAARPYRGYFPLGAPEED